MCVLSVIVWALNPFAALLLVPALHLWLWLAQPGARSRRWSVSLLLLLAIVPGVLVLIYYANAYGLSPIGLVWSLTLMTGGALSVVTALYWCVALGCLASALVIGVRAMRADAAELEPLVTVRGPTTLRRTRFAGRHKVGAAPMSGGATTEPRQAGGHLHGGRRRSRRDLHRRRTAGGAARTLSTLLIVRRPADAGRRDRDAHLAGACNCRYRTDPAFRH